MICYLDTTFCISPNCKNDCGIGLAEQYEVANAYLAEHPADEDEPITDAWLRELSDTPSSHAFAVCFRGVHGVALSVMRDAEDCPACGGKESPKSWDANPFVWAITFKKVEASNER